MNSRGDSIRARRYVAVALLAWPVVVAGCAHRGWCPPDHGPGGLHALPGEPGGRGVIVADLSAVRGGSSQDDQAESVPAERGYHKLHANDAQCLAAAYSVAAQLIEMERDMIAYNANRCRRCEPLQDTLQLDLLAHRSTDARNRSASRALTVFYLLAEAESQRESLARGFAEADRAARQIELLREQGLPVEADDSEPQRQRISLRVREEEMNAAIPHLNEQLRLLVGIDPHSIDLIWPEADWRVTPTVDVDIAIAEGLANRSDLAALRLIIANVDEDSLSSARSALQQADALLGSPLRAAGRICECLGESKEEVELETRRAQLMRLYAESEVQAVREIRHAVNTTRQRVEEVLLADSKLTNLRKRQTTVEQQRGAGKATPGEVSAARLAVITAESELNHQLIAWKLAEVKLKEVTGLLALECGFPPDLSGCLDECAPCHGE